MTPQEKAVIDAARAWSKAEDMRVAEGALLDAVIALDAPEAEHEIPWSQVVEGDQLKSIKNGKFYEVERIRIRTGDQREVWVKSAGKPFMRPRPGEETAVVRRGATGKVVDTFISVFSSGDIR